MKYIIFILCVLVAASAFAAKSVPVKGYIKKNGTYVAPAHRTAPNKTKADNYSSKGNVNPYTGKEGTKQP